MYVIWTILPTYDDRDAIYGSRALKGDNTYLTLACATKIAERLSEENSRDGGDAYYVVRPVGMSPFFNGPHPFFAEQALHQRWGGCYAGPDDELPF